MSQKPYTSYGAPATTTTAAPPTTTTTPTPTTTSISFFTRAESLSATRRPWTELITPSTFSVPISYNDAMSRIKRNLNHFRVNYAMVMLFILFTSLLWHPVSMIVFIIVFIAWLYFYFAREDDGPVVVFNQVLDDRVVLCCLSLVTIFALVFTHVGLNVLVALIVGVIVVGVLASFRITDDLFLDDESSVEGGLVSVVANQPVSSSRYTRI